MANLKCALASESASLDYIETANSYGCYAAILLGPKHKPAILEVFLLSEKPSAYTKTLTLTFDVFLTLKFYSESPSTSKFNFF